MSGPFGGFSISEKKKKIHDIWRSPILGCLMCAVLLQHSDLQVIHNDFQLFSTLYCS